MFKGFIRCLVLCLIFVFGGFSLSAGSGLDFTVSTKGTGEPAVLIIGGIQGDEPGGFSAAALLATQYSYTTGTVLVVPNLNFPSIIRRSRGVHGDMNRKFATLNPQDPEFNTVSRIQSIITSKEINLVLNLHDGSGFYRPRRESGLRNPQRWGQSIIIDQVEWPGVPFGNLIEIAENVAEDANRSLLSPDHIFYVRNTKTATDDAEMAKSLTWFALKNSKAAFGLEVSKELGVSERVYYHLCMVESFFHQSGVEFQRNFELSPTGITRALGSDIYISFLNNRLVLPLEDARRQQSGSLPLPKGAEDSISASMPIVAVTTEAGKMNIHYGNNTVTSFKPDWSEMDENLTSVMVQIDGLRRQVSFGETVYVNEHFLVESVPGYRVNAIGATMGKNESDMILRRADFMERYSVDNAATTFRVEVYKERLYCGTFLAKFDRNVRTVTAPETPVLPSINGEESELGW